MNNLAKSLFEHSVTPNLDEDDDFELWLAFLDVFNETVNFYNKRKKYEVFLQIGVCSHWLRPHQTRLTVAGGFAFPAGYDKTSEYGYGLPEFDWNTLFHYDKKQNDWLSVKNFFGKRKLVCRVAIPNRTQQHNQAAIHLMWSPGTPESLNEKLKMFYGFKKIDKIWKLTASSKI